MARSSYIYLILAPGPAHPVESTYQVVAAFTVKHECQSWLEETCQPGKDEWVVKRYRDGGMDDLTGDNGVVVRFDA